MRRGVSFRAVFPALAFLTATTALAARVFAPGEQVWCAEHQSFVNAPHVCERSHGVGWCDRCEGYFAEVSAGTHVHVGDNPASRPASADEPEVVVESAPEAADGVAGQTGGRSLGGTLGQAALSLLGSVPRKARVVGGAALVATLILAVAALKPKRKSAYGSFVFRNGRPQGVELVPGSLVCEREPAFDGGTAMGYRALFRSGRRWRPAFVKRMVGAGMRQDVRFPALRFESDALLRLSDTGVVPRVFAPAAETTASDGKYWAFYAMSVAQGEPWPERGGLGRDTRAALHALCEALVALHERGIGHHDLKPQNIFWDSRHRRVTLLDFGSAIDHSGSASALVNPLGATYPKTLPWVAPDGDGRRLAELSMASDAWVFGLLFCEALVGGIHDADRTKRRTPERPDDRDWLRTALVREVSPRLADAVVDGLFAVQRAHRMALRDFLVILREEWDA